MAEKIRIFGKSKIVPFEQKGDFFHRMACSHLENSNYFEALGYFRKALATEPDNAEYQLALAQTFTEMGHYEESNRIIIEMLGKEEVYPECYYGMGCNFLGMEDYGRAEESFKHYLQVEPDGDFSEEAEDLLDIIEEETAEEPPITLVEDTLQERAQEAKDHMDKGEYSQAIDVLKKIQPVNNAEKLQIENGIAMAHFCEGEYDEALEATEKVLEESPDDIHARCNMLLFAHGMGDEAMKEKCRKTLQTYETDDPKLLSIISFTLCEAGCHEDAYHRMKELLETKPYDMEMLHLYAASAYNSGRFSEASRIWNRMLKIDPEDLVATHFKALALKRHKGDKDQEPVEYAYQLPYNEMIQNIRRINESIKSGPAHMKQMWQEDPSFRALMRWGMALKDMTVKRAIIELVASFGDEESKRMLRTFIFRREEPDGLKSDVFTMLKYMGAKEPYIAYIDGSVVEVRVSVFNQGGRQLPSEYSAVLRMAMKSIPSRRDETFSAKVMEIWESFITARGDKLPKLFDNGAWAAALEYYTCMQLDIKVKKSEVCRVYGTRVPFMQKRLEEMITVLEEGNKSDTD